MAVETLARIRLDPPESSPLRIAFLSLWFVDMVAAMSFFVVPYAYELNPVTVLFYEIAGLPGVALAAILYALIIVFIGHVLSHPRDVQFTAVMVTLYTLFVVNNVLLLLFGEPLMTLIGL